MNASIGQRSTSPGFEQGSLNKLLKNSVFQHPVKSLHLVPIYQYGINLHAAENLPEPIETISCRKSARFVKLMALKDKSCSEYRRIMLIINHEAYKTPMLTVSM